MKVTVRWTHRSPEENMGRFGGGFQWALGFDLTRIRSRRGTLIINLLVGYIRINWRCHERR
jgi:hypothetical protein